MLYSLLNNIDTNEKKFRFWKTVKSQKIDINKFFNILKKKNYN